MKTPIADFIKEYAGSDMTRFHMPGHKGKDVLGFEKYDITEIRGADSMYEAEGIIAESERNATLLFGSGRTVFSTEGSSQCIRAMVYLAACESRRKAACRSAACAEKAGDCGKDAAERPLFIAARNVHKAFIYAAALADADVRWLYSEGGEDSLCACHIEADTLEKVLEEETRVPAAVYVTCPDYLGNMNDIKALADVCHRHGTILAVDNAHGAYLHFLETSLHPLDLGADICCDSAHKTLPVITGGAYLHISKNAPESFASGAKAAMGLFGSTSPSYLIMASLDLCNRYLDEDAPAMTVKCAERISELREDLEKNGWDVKTDTDPLRLTIRSGASYTGCDIAEKLREGNIECEYSDPGYAVLMITPFNTEDEIERISKALGKMSDPCGVVRGADEAGCGADRAGKGYAESLPVVRLKQVMSIREAVFSPSEMVDVSGCAGRVCASPVVSCPPAVPVAVSGELMDEKAGEVFRHYGIKEVSCVL